MDVVVEDESPVTGSLVAKLAFFAIALIVGPVAGFFFALNVLPAGSDFAAAGVAVVIIHVVVVAYLVAAFREEPASAKKKKLGKQT